jgi:hypothetical protein
MSHLALSLVELVNEMLMMLVSLEDGLVSVLAVHDLFHAFASHTDELLILTLQRGLPLPLVFPLHLLFVECALVNPVNMLSLHLPLFSLGKKYHCSMLSSLLLVFPAN